MSKLRIARVFLILALATTVLLALEASGLAQCSMCRASLAGSSNAYFVRSFNLGVLVLLMPPVAIFCSIFVILKRHDRQEKSLESGVKSRESGVKSPEWGQSSTGSSDSN